jgi:allophanate hydrolase subunit 1
LIGRTEAVLWDIERAQPALLKPGMWVQFRVAGTT